MKQLQTIILLALVALVACQDQALPATEGGLEPTATSEPAIETLLDTQRLQDALIRAGASVEPVSEVQQPFFSVPGLIIAVNGQDVQVFEYADAAQADSEAALITPDGSSIGTTMATWNGPPHFFRDERLIVLYVGGDQSIIELIESILGPQFAGVDSVQGQDAAAEPPVALLQIDGQEQSSGIGSYCWSDPDSGIALCNDKIGIPTSPEPIVIEDSFKARFINPLPTSPDVLVLSTTPVTPEDQLPEEVDGLRWWHPDPTEQFDLSLTAPHEIGLSLEPGLYVLDIFAQWQGIGDVSYGFLVEVNVP